MIEYFARCSLGKSRAFWCVWDEGLFDGGPPISHGYETTVEDAEARAKEVAGEKAGRGNSSWARRAHSRLVAERRRERPAKARGATKVEYVYNYWDWSDTTYFDEKRTPEATAYRVHKKTRRRLYVEDEPGLIESIERGLYQVHELRTFVLDRQEFEREGHARSRSKGWYYGDFYATAEAAISGHASCSGTLPSLVSEAVARLDLDESEIDQGMLKKAFRKKAFTAHPDHGAETGDFLRLEWDFEIIRRHFGWEN
jgi:hypothetical protein